MISQKSFIKEIYSYYKKNGRHDLPWRTPALKPHIDGVLDPYKILVSEIMLQQTQVDRVIPKYNSFLKKFPTVIKLAKASLPKVLREWSGLGYNRRAKFLRAAAQKIMENHAGIFPQTIEGLDALPGVGKYTAGAIAAFAFNQSSLFLETNIRAVYIHFFFPKKKIVSDEELLKILAHTVDKRHPREWYAALMDYGTKLKSKTKNPTRRSKTYVKQAVFKGSLREIRGKILKLLLTETKASDQKLKSLSSDKEKYKAALAGLIRDGLVEKKNKIYQLTK